MLDNLRGAYRGDSTVSHLPKIVRVMIDVGALAVLLAALVIMALGLWLLVSSVVGSAPLTMTTTILPPTWEVGT